MTVFGRVVLATAVAALLAPAGWAQEKGPKQVPLPNAILLARSWDEATKEAQIRNVPILFTTMMATWGECQGALGSVHRSKMAIEASLKVVNVVGILDQKHGSTTVMVNGRKEKRCSIVPGMTCDEHFKVADYAFLNGYPSVNGQVFVNVWNNFAKKPSKPVGNPGAEGYVQIVEEAIRKIDGTIILKPDYDAWAVQMDAARVAQEKKEVRKAIDLLSKLAKHEIVKLAGLADERLRTINEEGASLVAEAEKQAKENLAWSKDTLKRVAREYVPLDCSKTAALVLKMLEDKGK